MKIIPYNFCVANKTIDGKQCTIAWNVDDLKISHVNSKVVTTILNLLDEIFGQQIVNGKQAAITIHQGKKHDYLDMTLDYSEKGYIKIDMCEYVQKLLVEMPDGMTGTAKSPAADHLFQIVNGIKTLLDEDSKFFPNTVAKCFSYASEGVP